MNQQYEKKIGILGGTFNPIHTGHLLLAENAFNQFQLDKTIFLPSGNPPHKKNVNYIDAVHRAKMVELAIQDNPHFEISYNEINRKGITYTSDTLKMMKNEHPENKLYFILGADSLFTFDKWHEPDIICRCCTILVATREELHVQEIEARMEFLKDKLHAEVFRLILPDFDVSSNLIRKRINQGNTIKYLVPEKVLEYIQKMNLYIDE